MTPTPCPVSSRQRSAEWASQAAGNVCLAAGALPARAASGGVPVPRRDVRSRQAGSRSSGTAAGGKPSSAADPEEALMCVDVGD